MVFNDLDFLIELAKVTNGTVSTTEIAKKTRLSQQSASRKVIILEKEGMIKRDILGSGQKIRLTEKGIDVLEKTYSDLENVLENEKSERFVFSGTVFTGDGEGKYYMSLKGYADQIREKMGFVPYKGTLNLRLGTRTEIEEKNVMARSGGIVLEGFSDGERSFGEVRCFPCRINGTLCGAVIIPKRTHYPKDIIEIISKENLRKRFSIKNGDTIEIEVSQ
ncbi:MAG: CTP-dependent riboflavin kinase [Candidatus Aenigmarchaeota archaeon]|nr:CTP-dependent riboflavin kinase [Candidatus Aenigmarchaeota archaeon]